MWFFPRGSIPADLTAGGSVDPSTWSTPTAAYPVSSCALSNFGPQQMILTTTLCGQWAGLPSVYSQSCGTGTANASSCYLENVRSQCLCLPADRLQVINAGNPEYAEAYWSIRASARPTSSS